MDANSSKHASGRTSATNVLLHVAALAVLSGYGIAAPTEPGMAERAASFDNAGWARHAGQSSTVMRLAQAPTKRSEPETRPARPNEVKVEVLLLSDKLAPNSEEYIEAKGARYIYFNSPRLAAPARPLMEPKLRYPAGKLVRTDGAVMLQLLIDEQGRLEDASVVCAARGFARSALESVKGVRFRPARDKNGPVKSYMLVQFGYGRGYPCAPVPLY